MPDRMGFPAISIVVPNYNHAQYLPRCLTALVTQSAPPLEIIVIDDASTDNSLDMIEDFARQHACIRVIRNSTNQGVVAGMNRGVELAQGDYLLFAAADDQLLPGFLEKSVTLLRQHPQAAMCCTIGDWHEVATGLQLHVGVGMSDRPCFLAPAQCVDLEMRGRFYVASHTAICARHFSSWRLLIGLSST